MVLEPERPPGTEQADQPEMTGSGRDSGTLEARGQTEGQLPLSGSCFCGFLFFKRNWKSSFSVLKYPVICI